MKDFIKLEEISKSYKNQHQALKNISLDIKKGEIFALLGPNGAGKSTLISVICGLAYQTSGNIFIDNQNIKTSRKIIKSRIGLVPQELHLEAFETVFDNVCYLFIYLSIYLCIYLLILQPGLPVGFLQPRKDIG